MTALRALLVCAALALVGCGGKDDRGPRFASPEQHFSVHELPGWTTGIDRGMATFRSPGRDTVIGVRSVKLEGDWTEPRVPDVMLPATAKVLRGLPQASVAGPARVDDAAMTAWQFQVSFVPPGGTERVYRRHVVMFGDQRVFHVVVTSKAKTLGGPEAKAFAEVLASLREEA